MNRTELRERPAQPWAPSPLLYASGAVHLGAVVAALLRPGSWPWSLGALVANHAVLSAVSLWPKSDWLGPNITELPEGCDKAVAITIDDGPDPEVTPQVLDLLDQSKIKATFFCIGCKVLRYAEVAREIVRRGHSIENHTQRHRHNFSLLGPKGMSREIGAAQDSIEKVTGSAPRFFRAPAGLRNPFLDPVLAHHGLKLASWTRRGFDTVNGDADSVLRRLTHSLDGRDILLLHDGHAARGGGGRPVILDVLPRLAAAVHSQGLETVSLRAAMPCE